MDIEKKGGIMNESICQVEGNAKKKKKKKWGPLERPVVWGHWIRRQNLSRLVYMNMGELLETLAN